MKNAERIKVYQRQNGGHVLTPKQVRRLKHKLKSFKFDPTDPE